VQKKSHISSKKFVATVWAHNSIVDIKAIEVKTQGNKHSKIHNKNILQDIACLSNSRAQWKIEIIFKAVVKFYNEVSLGGAVWVEGRVIS